MLQYFVVGVIFFILETRKCLHLEQIIQLNKIQDLIQNLIPFLNTQCLTIHDEISPSMTSRGIFISCLNTTEYGYLCHSHYRNYQYGKYLCSVVYKQYVLLWSYVLRHSCRDDLHKMSYLNLWVDIKGLHNK